MSLRELQNYTYYSKYSRYLPEKKRRENWKESVERVRNMMLEKYKDFPDVHNDISFAYDFVLKKKILGSQRVLQFGGKPILDKNARSFNCTASYIDRLRFFQEAMYLLLCGCGVGFSVQKCHVKQLPDFSKKRIKGEQLPVKTIVIDDSIEGWADSVGHLINSYFTDDYEVIFDYSLIRPKGAYLSSSSGKAPGPDPLRNTHEKIRALLNDRLKEGKTRLRPIDAYDIVMHISDAVLSGGVRRSATLCLFSPDDEEMYNAKIGDWYYKNPQRGRSNNSAALLRDKTTFEQFKKLSESTKQFGEPGFIWVSHEDELWNPCGEAQLYSKTKDGKSGWQFCNLTSINGKKVKSREEFLEFARAAAIIGTLQAGFTNFPYLGPESEEITRREALLGVSITGIMENPKILLKPKNQKDAALEIKKTNEIIAKKIGINPASRLTNLKPEGTTSCFLGTSSGIHPHHARRYFRTVQANNTEKIFQFFKEKNPTACEESYWSANKDDSVIRFCVEVEQGAKLKNEVPALELLKAVKLTQMNWVEAGTVKNRLAIKSLKHNVSNTIHVKEDEWDKVIKFIYDNRKHFAGVSLLPVSGDKDYIQAPFCTIYLPEQMIKHYGDASMFASGLIEDCISSFSNLWLACDCSLGLFKTNGENQGKCIERVKRFADRYFTGNLKKATYLLKDVFNWKLWCDLQREYKNVNYEDLIEEEDFTKLEEELSCAGGKCEI